ncbi:MAG: hypothetical protein K6F05_01165 [Succinivibrio sp.]|nr:hypothetical protein [Succinivibrio sp.]
MFFLFWEMLGIVLGLAFKNYDGAVVALVCITPFSLIELYFEYFKLFKPYRELKILENFVKKEELLYKLKVIRENEGERSA